MKQVKKSQGAVSAAIVLTGMMMLMTAASGCNVSTSKAQEPQAQPSDSARPAAAPIAASNVPGHDAEARTLPYVPMAAVEVDEDKLYDVVEQMPQFPGGYKALQEWLKTNLRYPERCIRDSIEGRTIVTFTIEKTGQVTGARVLKSICEEMDQEALRLISIMPFWIPGKQNGVPVKVKYTLPITFRLNQPLPRDDG